MWIVQGRLKVGHEVLVCPRTQEHSPLTGLPSFGPAKLTANLDRRRRGDGVLVTSIRRFKDLEADALLMFDVPEKISASCTPADLYVGCSRAKHLLMLAKEAA